MAKTNIKSALRIIPIHPSDFSLLGIKWDNQTCGPSQVIQFAGITLDSINQEARLPEEKLQKCRLLLESFGKRRKENFARITVPKRSPQADELPTIVPEILCRRVGR